LRYCITAVYCFAALFEIDYVSNFDSYTSALSLETMALSRKTKRLLISLAFGFLFVFGYLFATSIFIFVFYRDRPMYAVRNVVHYWPLELPETIYTALGRDLRTAGLLINWLLVLLNVPLYAAPAYFAMYVASRLRRPKIIDQTNEPPPPPQFE
jgi:hypothetical protein